MDRESIQTVADLRMAVGYLGEKSQNNWWSSSFLAPQAKTYLSPIYPRTVALAQYRGVTEAALLVHDEFIGIGKVIPPFLTGFKSRPQAVMANFC